MSMEETRFILTEFFHEFIDQDTKLMRTVATDGHRLAKIDSGLPEMQAECLSDCSTKNSF